MAETAKLKLGNSRLAFMAALFFCISGVGECLLGMHRGMIYVVLGVIFLASGVLWIAIGVKFRKAEQKAAGN